MGLADRVKDVIGIDSTDPNNYHCPECDRTFEVDAPPERVICSSCGNKDVEVVSS